MVLRSLSFVLVADLLKQVETAETWVTVVDCYEMLLLSVVVVKQ